MMNEPRRYFPDWTHCAFANGKDVEADHNSYLAGGYAEEFGYMASDEWSRGVPVLDEPPDRSRKRRGQAQMTHPGYPLRAHPLIQKRVARVKCHKVETFVLADHGTYLSVHVRPRGEKQASSLERAAKRIAVHVASSIVALRWTLRHRGMFHSD